MESLQKRWNDWISSFKQKNASGDKEANIKSAQIVFVFGPEGTGKVSLCFQLEPIFVPILPGITIENASIDF